MKWEIWIHLAVTLIIIQFHRPIIYINVWKILGNTYLLSSSTVHAAYYVVQQIDVKLLVEIQKFGGLFSKSRHSDWETGRYSNHDKSQQTEIYADSTVLTKLLYVYLSESVTTSAKS